MFITATITLIFISQTAVHIYLQSFKYGICLRNRKKHLASWIKAVFNGVWKNQNRRKNPRSIRTKVNIIICQWKLKVKKRELLEARENISSTLKSSMLIQSFSSSFSVSGDCSFSHSVTATRRESKCNQFERLPVECHKNQSSHNGQSQLRKISQQANENSK